MLAITALTLPRVGAAHVRVFVCVIVSVVDVLAVGGIAVSAAAIVDVALVTVILVAVGLAVCMRSEEVG